MTMVQGIFKAKQPTLLEARTLKVFNVKNSIKEVPLS